MSSCQEHHEPLDAFDAFDTANLVATEAVDPPPVPPLATAQDLLDWVKGDLLRTQNQKSNECSAIRWLGRVDDTPLSIIPLADVRYLVDDRIRRIRRHKPLKKIRRSNIVTLLNQVLVRAQVLSVGTRRGGATSHAWTDLVRSMPTNDALQSLSTLGKFCSKRGIEPRGVTLEVWNDFADETLYRSTFKKPRATLQSTQRTSNTARKAVANWPLPEFPSLTNPRTYSVPRSELPLSLWQDVDVYVAFSGKPPKNIFDSDAPAQLRPDTLLRYREVVWRTASAQIHAGRPPAEIVNLAALLDFDWLTRGMTWLHERAGNKFLKDHLNTAAAWVSMADNYTRPSEEVRKKLHGIMKTIQKVLGPATFSDRNKQKLDQFSSPEVVEDFLFLPYQIMSEIKKKKIIAVKDATEMMAAVAIELLLATMVRRKNLADLDLSKHFWPETPTEKGKWSVLVNPEEVKNKQALRFPLQKQTINLLQFYMKKCWPLLKEKPTGKLFPMADGTPNGRIKVAGLVTRMIRRRLDLDVNLHLFRHIGTMLYLDAHPGDFGVPKIMLGHKSDMTTQRFYAWLESTKAIQNFTAAVLGARNERVSKLKIA
jgi:integrase